ncbi:hypothetical protein IMY05_014G0008200 [Salix suchowensis]|nr:hypothetical protein IMY05_014G0008200 [Salix suchowensis]
MSFGDEAMEITVFFNRCIRCHTSSKMTKRAVGGTNNRKVGAGERKADATAEKQATEAAWRPFENWTSSVQEPMNTLLLVYQTTTL